MHELKTNNSYRNLFIIDNKDKLTYQIDISEYGGYC